jgi:spore germination protein GerM
VSRAAALALLVTAAMACGRTPEPKPASAEGTAPAPPGEAAPAETAAPLPTSTVTLYFPSDSADMLAGEPREIAETARPVDRGAQILAALLEGPQAPGALPAFPEGTTLRRLWVREDGTAYADFSDELAKGMTGGSADELLTLYAIVDSLTLNVPEIKRVGVLVAGRERDTLGGHVDVRRPLPPNRSLVAKSAAKE